MTSPPSRYRALDTLRGIAALSVAIYHRHNLFSGHLAVDFFLVLSGFVLSHSYLYRERPIGTWNFIGRRLARLWPLHVVTIFTTAAIWRALNPAWPEAGNWVYDHCNLNTFLQNVALVHNVGLAPHTWSWNYPSWSISVEFWVNVVFILFITRHTKNWTLLGLAIVGLAIILWQTGSLKTYFENYFTWLNSGLVRGLSSFLLGILSYRFFLRYRKGPGLDRISSVLELLCLLVIALLGIARQVGYPSLEMLAPFFFMFMVPLFASERGLVSRWLRSFDHLGTISYSIYLNHVGLMIFVNSALVNRYVHGVGNIVLFPVLILLVSHFTYYQIELRGQRWMKALFARFPGGERTLLTD